MYRDLLRYRLLTLRRQSWNGLMRHLIDVLPLTKELINLCGNVWAHSPTSQLAERNE